jgi:hypothetical protein
MPILGIIASANQQGRGGGPESGYDSLATITVPSGGVASVTFAGIPAGYKHLQIRGITRSTAAQNYMGLRMQVGNGSIDTGSNYSVHELTGDGASATAGANTPQSTTFLMTSLAANDLASAFGVVITDLLDYGNTNKFKTFRTLGGADKNGAGFVNFNSGSWRNTGAINIITLYPSAGDFAQHSQLALYGVK